MQQVCSPAAGQQDLGLVSLCLLLLGWGPCGRAAVVRSRVLRVSQLVEGCMLPGCCCLCFWRAQLLDGAACTAVPWPSRAVSIYPACPASAAGIPARPPVAQQPLMHVAGVTVRPALRWIPLSQQLGGIGVQLGGRRPTRISNRRSHIHAAEYIVNARRTGVLRDLAFLERYQGVPGVLYAKPCVQAGAHVRGGVGRWVGGGSGHGGGVFVGWGQAAISMPACMLSVHSKTHQLLAGVAGCSLFPPLSPCFCRQVVSAADGLPTWVCQVLVTKPVLQEAIQVGGRGSQRGLTGREGA